ncbi:hypothetical protein Tco_1143798 [Tanacetum coccineum]
MLDELLEEFGDEILNVTIVDEETDFNPTKDLEELERLLAMRPQSNFTEIQIGTLYLLEGNMEMEPDIENMTISKYLEYEAAKERRLWDDVRSRRSSTHYDETDFNSFHQNKSNTFYYSYSHYLPTPPVQPYPKNYFVSTNESNDVDIENMTIAKYNLYVSKQSLGMNPLSNHLYGFTP